MLIVHRLLILILGVALSVTLYSWKLEKEKVEKGRLALKQAFDISSQEALHKELINEFILDLMGKADPWGGDRKVTLVEVLGNTYDKIEESFAKDMDLRAELLLSTGTCLINLGDHATGKKHVLRALELFEKLGSKGVRGVQLCRLELAKVLIYLGDFKAAKQNVDEAKAVLTNALGPHHVLTLKARTVAVTILRNLGHFEEALEEIEALLEVSRAQFGRHDHNTLNLMRLKGEVTLHIGRAHFARVILEETLRLTATHFGIDHPLTLRTKVKLAESLRDLGYRQEAIQLFSAVLDDLSEVLGEDHELTVSVDKIFQHQRKLGRRVDVKPPPPLEPLTHPWVLWLSEDFEEEGLSLQGDTLPGWKLFTSVFTNDANYVPTPDGPTAAIEEGALKFWGPCHQLLISKRRHVGDLRIHYRQKIESFLLNDASVFFATQWLPEPMEWPGTGYELKHGGYQNTLDMALRKGQYLFKEAIQTPLVRHRWHEIIAERRGAHLRLWVDGELILHVHDDDPLAGEDRQHFGLFGYGSTRRIDDIKVYIPEGSKALSASP